MPIQDPPPLSPSMQAAILTPLLFRLQSLLPGADAAAIHPWLLLVKLFHAATVSERRQSLAEFKARGLLSPPVCSTPEQASAETLAIFGRKPLPFAS